MVASQEFVKYRMDRPLFGIVLVLCKLSLRMAISSGQALQRREIISPETQDAAFDGRAICAPLFTLTASLMRREGLQFCVSAADLFAAAERLHLLFQPTSMRFAHMRGGVTPVCPWYLPFLSA